MHVREVDLMNIFKAEIERLFRVYYRPLCLYALHFTNDLDVAEDIVSDCYMRFYEILQDDKKEIKSTKTYLYTMVKNQALKSLSDRSNIVNDLSLADSVAEEAELIDRSFVEARLWAKIDELSTSCREIFLMSKRDGMKYTEIAQELGISPKTVENQISKAYRKLKEGAIKIYTFLFL